MVHENGARCRTRPPRSPPRARLAGPHGAVLVTGSLYLLADLAGLGEGVPSSTGPRLSVFVFAAIVIAAFAGLAFAVGYVVGKMLALMP